VKKTKTTNAEIIPAATAQVVQPKPTKSEIIEALTRLKIEEQDAARDKAQAAYEAQQEVVLDLALKHAATLDLNLINKDKLQYSHHYIEVSFKFTNGSSGSSYLYGSDREIHISAPADLKKEWDKASKLAEKVPSYWGGADRRYKEIRKEIQEALTRDAAGRVSRLLQDAESRAALSDMLKVVEAGAEKRIN